MKLVINKCFGGYGLSIAAVLWLEERGFYSDNENSYGSNSYYGNRTDQKQEDLEAWREAKISQPKGKVRSLFITMFSKDESRVLSDRPRPRSHPLLVRCVEELGESASGSCAQLEVIEIPDGVEWEIDEYDGVESIHETHRSWG